MQTVRELGKWYVVETSCDARVWTTKPKLRPVGQPETLTLRMVDVLIRQPGYRAKTFTIATTFTDQKACPRAGSLPCIRVAG